MNYLFVVIQITLASVFLIASVTKIANPSLFSANLRRSRFFARFVSFIGVIVPLTEFALFIGLMFGSLDILPYLMLFSMMLLALFTLWLGGVVRAKLETICNCLGEQRTRVGLHSILRNVVLISVAALGFVLSKDDNVITVGKWGLPLSLIMLLAVTVFVYRKYRIEEVRTVVLAFDNLGKPATTFLSRRGFLSFMAVTIGIIWGSKAQPVAAANCPPTSCRCYPFTDPSSWDCSSCPDGCPYCPGCECWALVYRTTYFQCCHPYTPIECASYRVHVGYEYCMTCP